MSKKIRKFLFGDLFNVEEYEEYFSEMSKDGLHLEKVGNIFAYFKEGESKRLNYRIDIVSEKEKEKTIKRHEKKGWQFVCEKDLFLIFISPEDSNLKELYCTPEEQKLALKNGIKELSGEKIINIFIGLMMLAIIYMKIDLNDGFYLTLVKEHDLILFIITVQFPFLQSISRKRRLRKIQKILNSGEFLKHQGDYSLMKTKFLITKLILYFSILLVVGVLFYKMSQNRRINISEIENLDSLPVVTIKDIEGMDYRLEKSKIVFKDDNIDYGNNLYEDWNLFVPKEKSLIQTVTLYDENEKDTGIKPQLIVDYYEARFDFIAKGLEKDILVQQNYGYPLRDNKIQKQEDFSCYGVEKKDENVLLCRKGKEVIFLRYYNGTVSLEELMEIIIKKLD